MRYEPQEGASVFVVFCNLYFMCGPGNANFWPRAPPSPAVA